MRSILSLTILVTLLECLIAVQATPVVKKRSFKVRARSLTKRRHHPQVGSDALLNTFRKWGFDLPGTTQQNVTAAADTPDDTSTVQAVPEANEAEFLEKVTIGGQEMTLDFDTGSADLWVFNTLLPESTIGQHAAFNPQNSQSFSEIQGASWQIQYGDGSGAAGIVGTDTVEIGGATVTGQAVQLATAVSESFIRDTNNDGLMGLAFSGLNTVRPQQKTFFDNVMENLKQPVFSVDLREDTLGTYEFGAIDTTKVKDGKLTTVPVDSSRGFWQFTSNSVAVGGQTLQNPSASPAIADTGTSLLVVDDAVAQAYYSQVQGAQLSSQAGGYVYPCDAQLPDFSVAMGDDYMATVPGSGITFGRVSYDTCFGGVQSNGGSGLQIFGDVLLKTQYVVFDGKAEALYVGPKA